MDEIGSLNHAKWECKYHIMFIPKGRRKVLYGQLRKQLAEVFHELARHKETRRPFPNSAGSMCISVITSKNKG